MPWKNNGFILGMQSFFFDIWQDIRDVLRLILSGLIARYVFKLATKLLGEADETTFIHKVDIWGGNIVFLSFVLVGLISFILKSYYKIKTHNLEHKGEYEKEKREYSKYLSSGVENLPGKTGDAFIDAAQGLDDFDPEDE